MARPSKTEHGKGNVEWTKQQLILAAAEQFALFGFEGASLSKIRERVGVKNSTIMYHFKSKAGLHLAVKEHLEQSLGQFANSLEPHKNQPVLPRFSLFCQLFKQWSEQEQTYTAIIVQEMMNKQMPAQEHHIYKNIGKHFQQITQFIQGQPIDPLWRELNWPVFTLNLTFTILIGQAISHGVPVTLNMSEQEYKQQQLQQVISSSLLAHTNDQTLVEKFLAQ